MRLITWSVLLVCASAIACACGGPGDAGVTPVATGQASLRTIELRYDGGSLTVEVAASPEERGRGLSGREQLPDGHGMLFDLGETRIPTFVMRGMRFPLDIVWIDEERRVVGIEADVRPEPGVSEDDLRRYSPDVPARFVLEINGGVAAREGIRPGTLLEFDLGE